MDTTDSKIVFDASGVCDHCLDFKNKVLPKWNYGQGHDKALVEAVQLLKAEGKGKEFDCILGLSGGVDSSYMLHLAVTKLGLRPLVFHVDGGWNSELAVNNVEVLVRKLGLHLFTEVIDWEEMRQMQLAFFRSGVPHIDIPQDHAFISVLYKFAEKHKIRWILNGGNIATEGVRNPLEWLYYGTDMWQIRDILRRFCSVRLKNYPFSSIWRHKVFLRYVKRVRMFRPLNLMAYNKQEALRELSQVYSWKPYSQKHFESRFTKFFEGYWLPERFGFDTRKVQYSSLILSGQMSRKEALEKLKELPYDKERIRGEFDYIAKKLEIGSEELRWYMEMPRKCYRDYQNQESLFNLGAKVLRMIGAEPSIKR